MTGPGTGREGGEKSDPAVEKERKDEVKEDREGGVDKSNIHERRESAKSKQNEEAKDDDRSRDKEEHRKPHDPKEPKGRAYDDSNRVEREDKRPYELPPSVRPEQGSGSSSQRPERKDIDFPKGKDSQAQLEETRKKLAEDAERTKQEQRRLMTRLR